MLRLYLIRHGVTRWNHEARMQGQSDIDLAPEGFEQARLIACRLAREPLDAVWSSDLVRAWDTAREIAAPHGLCVHVTPLLRECGFGAWEGLTEADIMELGQEDAWRAYRADPVATRPPGGERLEEVWDRILQGVQQLRREHPSGNVALVGHGGSMRAILCHALGSTVECFRRIWLDNASLSIVEYEGERMWVKLMNDTCHLGGIG
ncbi:MAG: histidine phosphatase family protein [Chthonomonadales bacterium]